MLTLSDSVSLLPGVGPTRSEQLAELGLHTLKDLLYYPPFRYETVERQITIKELQPDTTVCLYAQVLSKLPIRTPRFKSMTKASVTDGIDKLDLTWFNNSFILSSLKVGEWYYFTGKVALFKNKPTLTNPSVEHQIPEFGSLVPIYHESADITSRFLRKLIKQALQQVTLTDSPKLLAIYQSQGLLPLTTALQELHHPTGTPHLLDAAKSRLAFDEMFTLIQDVIAHKKAHQQSRTLTKLTTSNDDIKTFASFFSYALTSSQHEAITAISLDLIQPHPMHRLLQGEVGSGKTTVAAFALWTAARHGSKALLICPTKILAQQHFATLTQIFHPPQSSPTSISSSATIPTIGLFTGKEKNLDADILVGTHALFNQKGLKPALVVIDEEHRFGVNQRETFFKNLKKPHFLSMTATPIPRTVALTALADRDLSFISPHKSNTNIKTWVVPVDKRASAYPWIADHLGQCLVVCPFIEASLVETLTTVKSAKLEFDRLKDLFPHHKLALLHGKIDETKKTTIFSHMMTGKIDILVTTPVVEVGVDIPGANIIVIEGAERFGLAQLHQLRGRVGRRGQPAYCLLFTSENQPTSHTRLEHFSQTYDGNALAQYDLEHRGSGELLGVAQHGFDALRFARWSDHALIETCKALASQLT